MMKKIINFLIQKKKDDFSRRFTQSIYFIKVKSNLM